MSFDALKRNAGFAFERLQQEMLKMEKLARLDETSAVKWTIRDRVIEALNDAGNFDLSGRIEQCRTGNTCGSLWCPDCRTSTAVRYHAKIAEKCWTEGWGNDDLFHLTAHLGLCEVNPDQVLKMIDNDGRFWRRARTRCDGLWVEAVYEFELVSLKALQRSASNESSVKKKQIEQMLDWSDQSFDDLVLYVHWHGLSNKHPEDWVKEDYHQWNDQQLQKPFRSSESGIFVQRLRSDQSLQDNLLKITSYPFKNPVRFKHSFVGSDWSSGEQMTADELRQLVETYDLVQGRQKRRLFRTVD